MTLAQAYADAVRKHGHAEDEAQLRVVAVLERLRRQLQDAASPGGKLRRLLGGFGRQAPRGVYLWGGVGRGKTFLMDLFHASLAIDRKKRIHFHRMMREIHERLNRLGDVAEPLDHVAAAIAAETRVLCFDEFYVSEIGDAMILGRLLEGLFRRDVVLVTTSNVQPADLYKDGLQRARFLPVIELLETHTQVIELEGSTDYRLELFQKAGTYLTPCGRDANARLMHYFEEIASGDIVEKHVLDVLGRGIGTERCAKGVVWFSFTDICDGPRGQQDYIEIARWFPAVIISDVPVLDRSRDDPARRFVALVDEFYDRKVKLIVSAATGIDALYQGNRLRFEFARTASRLAEMQSIEYLHAPHRA